MLSRVSCNYLVYNMNHKTMTILVDDTVALICDHPQK